MWKSLNFNLLRFRKTVKSVFGNNQNYLNQNVVLQWDVCHFFFFIDAIRVVKGGLDRLTWFYQHAEFFFSFFFPFFFCVVTSKLEFYKRAVMIEKYFYLYTFIFCVLYIYPRPEIASAGGILIIIRFAWHYKCIRAHACAHFNTCCKGAYRYHIMVPIGSFNLDVYIGRCVGYLLVRLFRSRSTSSRLAFLVDEPGLHLARSFNLSHTRT